MSRGQRYVERTREEVTELFLEMKFKEVVLPGCHEVVFEREVIIHKHRVTLADYDTGLNVRVYTSVSNDGTRKCGKDAGRVILVDRNTGRGVWSAKRCHRTQNFLKNMRSRCRDAWKAAATLPKCPTCKGHMVARKRKGEKAPTFWGCIKYPQCTGTRNIE